MSEEILNPVEFNMYLLSGKIRKEKIVYFVQGQFDSVFQNHNTSLNDRSVLAYIPKLKLFALITKIPTKKRELKVWIDPKPILNTNFIQVYKMLFGETPLYYLESTKEYTDEKELMRAIANVYFGHIFAYRITRCGTSHNYLLYQLLYPNQTYTINYIFAYVFGFKNITGGSYVEQYEITTTLPQPKFKYLGRKEGEKIKLHLGK